MRVASVIAEEPEVVDGGTRLRATVEIDLTVEHEVDAIRRVPQALWTLSDRLLALWQLNDLADAAEFVSNLDELEAVHGG